MDWKLFGSMLYYFSSAYVTIFCWLYLVAGIFCKLIHYGSRFENAHWKMVTAYRFLWPARRIMCIVYMVSGITVRGDSFWYYINYVFAIYACFFWKDNHDDDPRDKKPSKVKAFVKSLGHKLVVVPSHG